MITEDLARWALPTAGFVHAYVQYGQYITDAPAIYHVGVAHALLGAVLPSEVSIRYGGSIYGNQWVLLVGESGDSRKSVAISIGRKIMAEVNRDLLMLDIQSELSVMTSLQQQPSQLLIYSEFGNFLKGTKMGSHKESLRTRFMELWDCDSSSYKTGKREIYIEDPRLSMLAGVAPYFLIAQTTEEDWRAGFLNRWMLLVSERPHYEVPTHEPPPAQGWPEMQAYLVNYLSILSQRNLGPCVDWHPEAVLWWREWVQKMEAKYGDVLSVSGSKGFMARAKVVCLKTALTYSLDFGEAAHCNGAPWRMGVDVLEPASRLAELHLMSTIYSINSFGLSKHAKEQRAVLAALGNKTRTLGGIIRRTRPAMDKRDVRRVLETLVEARFAYYYRQASVDGQEFWSHEPFGVDTALGNVIPFKE